MQNHLDQLVSKLSRTYGGNLVSVILYGSAASGDFDPGFSDLNVICVLEQVGMAELRAAERLFHWWREQGNPAPLLLSEAELRSSTDCFPIEYQDMLDSRRVLHGRDVIADLPVDRCFYRAQVECELRAKVLRLRQKAAAVLDDRDLLLRLMADSIPTFLILARHALRLAGDDPGSTRRETAVRLAARLEIDAAPFETLLDLRSGLVKAKTLDAPALFEQYLRSAQALAGLVDGLNR